MIDKSDFDIILKTWRTEKPPNPSKKAHKIIWWEIILLLKEHVKLIPFVSSINPVINDLDKLRSILNDLKRGFISVHTKSIILLSFKIDIITEKSTTKPPTIVTVNIAFFMLLPNISPRLEIVADCLFLT